MMGGGRATLEILQAGPHTSVQDAGRAGLARFGVPASGPMDRTAFAIAHAALGNAPGDPAIEVAAGGLTLECREGAVTVAVAGGGFHVSRDDGAGDAHRWRVTSLRAGMRLAIRPGVWGSWTYVTVAGRLAAPRWLGSAATHAPSGLGGGALSAGQRVQVEDAELRAERDGPIPCPAFARPRCAIRVVLGPQERFFSPATVNTFLSAPFALTDAYDRMGVRLRGPALRVRGPLDMPSEAIVRGSVQVSGDGAATILLADHPTTGGYPRIATVIGDDLDGLAQLRSHDIITFHPVTPEEAIEAARAGHRARERYRAGLSRA